MTAGKIDDLKADQNCMSKCVSAFTELSRHHCELHSSDSVAVRHAEEARVRVLQWLAAYLQNHRYL